MSEQENHSVEIDDQREDLGKIEISPEVIEIIAGLAAVEVMGVGDMHGGVVEKLSGKKYGRGVKVDLTDTGVVIDVQLSMDYGVSIPEVAEKVQDNIARALKQMTALDVHEVNIHVVGIRFQQKAKQTSGDDE